MWFQKTQFLLKNFSKSHWNLAETILEDLLSLFASEEISKKIKMSLQLLQEKVNPDSFYFNSSKFKTMERLNLDLLNFVIQKIIIFKKAWHFDLAFKFSRKKYRIPKVSKWNIRSWLHLTFINSKEIFPGCVPFFTLFWSITLKMNDQTRLNLFEKTCSSI